MDAASRSVEAECALDNVKRSHSRQTTNYVAKYMLATMLSRMVGMTGLF
jgi:hypothetical protein